MKIILSEEQLKFLLEWTHKEEFDEVYIMPPFSRIGSKSQINLSDIENDSLKNEKKLIWKNKLNLDNYFDIAYIESDNPKLIKIKIYDESKNIVMLVDMLESFLDGNQIKYTSVSTEASGKKLGAKCYARIVELTKKPLYSDEIQTEETKYGIWFKLYEQFPNKIFAYSNGKDNKIKKIGREFYYNKNKKVYRMHPELKKYFNDDSQENEGENVLLKLIP